MNHVHTRVCVLLTFTDSDNRTAICDKVIDESIYATQEGCWFVLTLEPNMIRSITILFFYRISNTKTFLNNKVTLAHISILNAEKTTVFLIDVPCLRIVETWVNNVNVSFIACNIVTPTRTIHAINHFDDSIKMRNSIVQIDQLAQYKYCFIQKTWKY